MSSRSKTKGDEPHRGAAKKERVLVEADRVESGLDEIPVAPTHLSTRGEFARGLPVGRPPLVASGLSSTPTMSSGGAAAPGHHGNRMPQDGLLAAHGDAHARARAEGLSRSSPRLGLGQGLPPTTRQRLEHGLGTDLGSVRVHADPAGAALARAHSARAVTLGSDVAFAPGQYRPDTLRGSALIAHEAAHTVQQRGATSSRAGQDPAAERAANRAAVATTLGRPAGPLGSSGLRFQACIDPPQNYAPSVDQIEASQITGDPDITPPPASSDLPSFVPSAAEAPSDLASQLASTDASVREQAVATLASSSGPRSHWNTALLAQMSRFPEVRAQASTTVQRWMTEVPEFADYLAGLAAAPYGLVSDMAIRALVAAGQGGTVDVENYRRVVLSRLDLAGQRASELGEYAGATLGVVDSLDFGLQQATIYEWQATAQTAELDELVDIGARASTLLVRYGVLSGELAALESMLESAGQLDPTIVEALETQRDSLLNMASRITATEDDEAFQAVLDSLNAWPAVYVVTVVSALESQLTGIGEKVDDAISQFPELRAQELQQKKTEILDPVLNDIGPLLERLAEVREGAAADPAGAIAYLVSIGPTVESISERLLYATSAVNAALARNALTAPPPESNPDSCGMGYTFNRYEGLRQALITAEQSFRVLAEQRDTNPEQVRALYEGLGEQFREVLESEESYNAMAQAIWNIQMVVTDIGLLVAAILSGGLFAGLVRGGLRVALGTFARTLTGRVIVGVAGFGANVTAFHFTHEGLRSLIYNEEFWDEDFVQRWGETAVLFALLGGSSRLYGRFAGARLIRAGRTGLAATGEFATSFVVFQGWSVAQARLQPGGEWVLPNNPRFWGMAAQNLILLGALHIALSQTAPIAQRFAEQTGGRLVSGFNRRATALRNRIERLVQSNGNSAEVQQEALAVLARGRQMAGERATIAEHLHETSPEVVSESHVAAARENAAQAQASADAALFEARINLRPHETDPNTVYYEGSADAVRRHYRSRDFREVEIGTGGRFRMENPEGEIIDFLQLSEQSRAIEATETLTPQERSLYIEGLVERGTPRETLESLSDADLVRRHEASVRRALEEPADETVPEQQPPAEEGEFIGPVEPVVERAEARYDEAVESGYAGQYTREEFVRLYRQGYRFNANHRWERIEPEPTPPSTTGRAPSRPLSELAQDVPPPSANEAFESWFDALTHEQFMVYWGDRGTPTERGAREVIEDAVRHPGGYHEWLKVSQLPNLKSWGVSMSTIRGLRSLTQETEGLRFQHGGYGSTRFHNELDAMFEAANAPGLAPAQRYQRFLELLNTWADTNMLLGRHSLPEGLQVRRTYTW